VNMNANNVFQNSLRKGTGTGGNPTPNSRRSMTPRETFVEPEPPREEMMMPPPLPPMQEEMPMRPPMPHPGTFANPLAMLRDPEQQDLEYVYPGRTHPGVYNPYSKEFDGGFANYYDSPEFLYDRGVSMDDLPQRMPSRHDLSRIPRDSEGLPIRRKQGGARGKTISEYREHLPPSVTPADAYTGRIVPERGFNRALRDDVQVNPSTGPFQTVHRSSWKDHYDDDHVYWKGWAAGRDVYTQGARPVQGAHDQRRTHSSVDRSMCQDQHGGMGRSMFNGKPAPYAQFR